MVEGIKSLYLVQDKVLSTMRSFSGSKGPISLCTMRLLQFNLSASLFTFTTTSTWSRIITAPSGRRIRSISSKISIMSHLQEKVTSSYVWAEIENFTSMRGELSLCNFIKKKSMSMLP